MAVSMGTTRDYRSLQAELLKAKVLFSDPQFPPNYNSLFLNGDPKSKLGSSLDLRRLCWKRPIDLVEKPVLIYDGVNRHDMDQGQLGDCWFIAGAALLASTDPSRFEKFVPSDQGFETDRYTGLFRFNFFWLGKWEEVIIDDYLPTNGKTPLFAQNYQHPNEFWPCLLEKAYAKLRGNYETLVSGRLTAALVDLTGGISESKNIHDKSEISPELYSLLHTFKMKSLAGAFINKTKDGESEVPNGLIRGHAYSITKFAQIPTSEGTVNLLRIRNPWNKGEWNGPWSDKSREIENLPQELKKQLRIKDRIDGEFWNFSGIDFCHLQPDARMEDKDEKQMWNVTMYHDAWLRGVTAGGCGNGPYESLFWINPQFYFTLKSPDNLLGNGDDCTVIVSLMKMEKTSMSDIFTKFDVYKLKNPDLRPLDESRARKNGFHIADSGKYIPPREFTTRLKLQPGTYVIIPSTFYPHEEAKFLLRLFTEKHIDSGVLDNEPIDPPVTAMSFTKKYLTETFERHAGQDKRLDAVELSAFLEDISMTEFGDMLKFPVESCRSLVTLMDENKSGFLDFYETKRAWKQIKTYRDIFKQFDSNSSNTVSTYELAKMFSRLGFPISRAVLTVIIRRYGGRNNEITLPDFIMIICKLTSLFASFTEQQRKRGHDNDLAKFKRDEFLEVTMFILFQSLPFY